MTGKFSPAEWKQVLNAPQLIHHLLTATDKGTFFTKRSEAKALEQYLKSAGAQSPLVKSLIDGQKDADEKIEATPEEAERVLRQVGQLLESRSDDVEGDAVRSFLLGAGEAIAAAAREQNLRGGKAVSAAEQQTLDKIAVALKATEADKRRRHAEAVAAEARKQAEAQKAAEEARQKREAEAQKKAEEAREKLQAEAKKRAEEAREEREAEAKQRAEEARHKRETEEYLRQQEEKREAQFQKAQEAKAQREAAAKLKAEEAQKQVASAPAPAPAAPAAPAAEKGAETIYVVKRGDTLSGIAKSVYGNAGRWREIFEANKDIIENPNLIRPGWKLRIPN